MKKIMLSVIAALTALIAQVPCAAAAEMSAATGDASIFVIIALVVAAVAIIGTVIYTRMKK